MTATARKQESVSLDISVRAKDLADALKRVAPLIDNKSAVPALKHVRLIDDADRLLVRACDTIRGLDVTIDCQGQGLGDVLLPATALQGLVSGWWGGSSVSLKTGDNGRVTVASGRSRYKLASLDPLEFPEFGGPGEGAVTFTLPGADLAAALERVSWAMESDRSSRHYLCGAYLHTVYGHLTLAATDGKAAAVVGIPLPEGLHDLRGAIVPDDAVPILAKLATAGDVTLTIDAHKLAASAGDVRFITKLVDGTFPDYRRVLPEPSPERSALADRPGLLAALKRLEAVSDDGKVNLTASVGNLTVANWRAAAGEGVEEIDAEAAGDLAFSVNRRWLVPALGAFSGDRILIEHASNRDPVRLTGPAEADGGLVVVVMPATG